MTFESCQTTATCGNEIQVVNQPRSRGNGVTTSWNQTYKAKKRKKASRLGQGLFGKEGNPYSSRKPRKYDGKD